MLNETKWDRPFRNARRIRIVAPFPFNDKTTSGRMTDTKWALSFEALQTIHAFCLIQEGKTGTLQAFFPNVHTFEWPWKLQQEHDITFMPSLVGSSNRLELLLLLLLLLLLSLLLF